MYTLHNKFRKCNLRFRVVLTNSLMCDEPLLQTVARVVIVFTFNIVRVSLRFPPLLQRQHAFLQHLKPVFQPVRSPQINFAVPAQYQSNGAVGLLVFPLHPVNVDQFDFEEELAHLGYPVGS